MNSVIRKGGLYCNVDEIDKYLIKHTQDYMRRKEGEDTSVLKLYGDEVINNHNPGVVNEPLFRTVVENFRRAEKDIPVSHTNKQLKLYVSLRENTHTNLVAYEKCLLAEERDFLYNQQFLYDGSTSIKSKESAMFYDLIMLACFETLNAVVDKEKISVKDIREKYVMHSVPLTLGACYLNDCYVVVITLAMDNLPYFAELCVALNEKYDIMPLDQLKVKLKAQGKDDLARVFESMALVVRKEKGLYESE